MIFNTELRPSVWTREEWDVIGQHDHSFAGIAASNRFSMKALFYAAQILFINKASEPATAQLADLARSLVR